MALQKEYKSIQPCWEIHEDKYLTSSGEVRGWQSAVKEFSLEKKEHKYPRAESRGHPESVFDHTDVQIKSVIS